MKRWFLLATANMLMLSNVHAVDIEAGPIWNNNNAQQKCPGVCTSKNLQWTGHWVTTVQGKMSVCKCDPKTAQPTITPTQASPGTTTSLDAKAKATELLRKRFQTLGLPVFDSIKGLIDDGADVNVPIYTMSGETTILHRYVGSWGGNLEAAKFLIEKGANVNAKNAQGSTPLMDVSSYSGNLETAKLLIEKGADVNAKDAQGSTALMKAVGSGKVELAKLLIEKGADVNAKNAQGSTALMKAAGSGKVELAKLLIEKGADVNAKNAQGSTALMEAVGSKKVELAKLLIEKGADLNAQDSGGMTPLKIAEEENNKAMIDLLTKKTP